MSETQKLFYDDCFITKYKRLRGLVPGVSCDSMTTTGTNKRSVTNNVDYFSFRLTESQLYQCWKIIHHKTAMKDVKLLNKLSYDENIYNRVEDLMLLIPSTSSKRLENSAWRAWAKERFQLDELNPAKLNWFKENDITWLYGPLIINEEDEDEELSMKKKSCSATTNNKATATQTITSAPLQEHQQHAKRPILRSTSSESLSSISSTDSLSSVDTASTSITADDLTNFHSKPLIKPILKTDSYQLPKLCFDELNKLRSKSEESFDKRKKRVSFNSVMEKREIIDDEVFDYNLQFIDNERIGYGYY